MGSKDSEHPQQDTLELVSSTSSTLKSAEEVRMCRQITATVVSESKICAYMMAILVVASIILTMFIIVVARGVGKSWYVFVPSAVR